MELLVKILVRLVAANAAMQGGTGPTGGGSVQHRSIGTKCPVGHFAGHSPALSPACILQSE
jgi:hypothetical protein